MQHFHSIQMDKIKKLHREEGTTIYPRAILKVTIDLNMNYYINWCRSSIATIFNRI